MAVITGDGIVGKIREVFPHTAQVLDINDQSSGAGVILETTRVRGILRGNAEGQPQIVGILADQRIKPGENVLTAGGDQIFPRGLPVGVVDKVVEDPDRDGFINIVIKPAAHLDRLDEVMVITSTEPRFGPQEQKDLATSEALKSADAAVLADQRKASLIMAERLPGLTDPNAPPKPAAAPGVNGAPATQPTTVVPKILLPAHPDRFTPGHSGQPEETGPAATPAPKPSSGNSPAKPASKPEKNQAAPAAGEPEPKSPAKPTTPPPQGNQ